MTTIKTFPVPPGYRLVPIEPSAAQLYAGCKASLDVSVLLDGTPFSADRACYKAMVDTAPEISAEPSPGLLMSMAIRFDHGLGVPGYYDQSDFQPDPEVTHAERLAWTIQLMRTLYDEMIGNGFYSPDKELYYAELLEKSDP